MDSAEHEGPRPDGFTGSVDTLGEIADELNAIAEVALFLGIVDEYNTCGGGRNWVAHDVNRRLDALAARIVAIAKTT